MRENDLDIRSWNAKDHDIVAEAAVLVSQTGRPFSRPPYRPNPNRNSHPAHYQTLPVTSSESPAANCPEKHTSSTATHAFLGIVCIPNEKPQAHYTPLTNFADLNQRITMPSNRRLKYLLALVALVLFVTLYYSNDAHQSQNAEFYKKTKLALEKSTEDKRLKAEADAKLQNILKHAKDLAAGENVAEVAKAMSLPDTGPPTNEVKKIPPPPPSGSEDDVDEISIAGRKMMPKPKPWAVGKDEEIALNGGRLEKVEEPGIAEAKEELNGILKKSPMIIFSKSYCPYSKRAKSLLLDTYKIVPAPHVVELDLLTEPISDAHDESPPTLGRKLQDLLAETTGRRTVPNILVNGRSIGGSDELAKLDADDELVKVIREMGGRWVHEVERRDRSAAAN